MLLKYFLTTLWLNRKKLKKIPRRQGSENVTFQPGLKLKLTYNFLKQKINWSNAKRRRQRELPKKSSLISNKKQLSTCNTLFCIFLCRCFARPQRAKLSSYKKNVVCAHQGFCCLCSCSPFFRCRLFLPCQLLLAKGYHFSFPHRRYKFSSCFSNKIRLLCFLSRALALRYPRQCRY